MSSKTATAFHDRIAEIKAANAGDKAVKNAAMTSPTARLFALRLMQRRT